MTQAALTVALDVSRKAINEREKGGTHDINTLRIRGGTWLSHVAGGRQN